MSLNIMTSSNRLILRITGPLFEEFTDHQWNKASDAEFDVFVDLRQNKRLSKQLRRDLRPNRA